MFVYTLINYQKTKVSTQSGKVDLSFFMFFVGHTAIRLFLLSSYTSLALKYSDLSVPDEGDLGVPFFF